MDPDIQRLLARANFAYDFGLDPQAWEPGILRCLYTLAPMLLLRRKGGYCYIGSGRALSLAQEIYGQDEEITALVVKSSKIKVDTKLRLLAADLLGMPALVRTRHGTPEQLLAVWRLIQAAGVTTVQGNTARSFAHATGFSQKSLVRASHGGDSDGQSEICAS